MSIAEKLEAAIYAKKMAETYDCKRAHKEEAEAWYQVLIERINYYLDFQEDENGRVHVNHGDLFAMKVELEYAARSVKILTG